MARSPRIEFSGAFYHIIVRGNQKQSIFIDDGDRREYLARVQFYKAKLKFILYSYVLMSNHVHLLVETPGAPISKIMQVLNFTYTQYFNRKYKKSGHLFQGRYKSLLCDRDEYLLALVRYIHLNPVRAGIVKTPDEYAWSSHAGYLRKQNELVDCEKVLRLFSESVSHSKKLYRAFVNEALGSGSNEEYYRGLNQQILGDERFVDEVGTRLEKEKPAIRPSLDTVVKAIEEVTGIKRAEVVSRVRNEKAVRARGLLVGTWRELGYKMVQLQPFLKRDLSTLSKLATAATNESDKRAMRRILKHLNSRFQA